MKFNARNIAGGLEAQYDSLEDLVDTEGPEAFSALSPMRTVDVGTETGIRALTGAEDEELEDLVQAALRR
jgi:hypothetical protein